MSTDQALKYLSRNALLHTDMTETIKRNEAEIVDCSTDGVLLYLPIAGCHSVSARSSEAALELVASARRHIDVLILHRSEQLADLQQKYPFDVLNTCYQSVYLETEPLPETSQSYPIRALGAAYQDLIQKHYPDLKPEYILDRLNSGMIYGAFSDNTLIGFIGIHQEGSIGMLEVMAGYRRTGVAAALQTYLTNHFVRGGLVPYAQIPTRNKASLALQKKLGYQISRQKIVWLQSRDELSSLNELMDANTAKEEETAAAAASQIGSE